jgi:hypothetical protein
MRVWMLGLLYDLGESSGLKVTAEVTFPLRASPYAMNVDKDWLACDADCEKDNKMIRRNMQNGASEY